MLSWVAKKLLDHTMGRLREGETGPTTRLYADDVRFTFPGRSTWAGQIEGKRRRTTPALGMSKE